MMFEFHTHVEIYDRAPFRTFGGRVPKSISRGRGAHFRTGAYEAVAPVLTSMIVLTWYA